MRRNTSKAALYESIMRKVSGVVKKAINEKIGDDYWQYKEKIEDYIQTNDIEYGSYYFVVYDKDSNEITRYEGDDIDYMLDEIANAGNGSYVNLVINDKPDYDIIEKVDGYLNPLI